MLIKNADVYQNLTGSFSVCDLRIENGMIADMGSLSCAEGENCIDATGCYIVPGLVDVHTHGRVGQDFVDCTGEAPLHPVAAAYASHGITTVMPTLASAPFAQMQAAANSLCDFIPAPGEANFCGVHLEGRYLNPAKKGAHAPELLAPLDPQELESFRSCHPLHITAALELDAGGRFAARALSLGATLGLGHTAANYAQAKEAEANGISSYTHLFNAMPPLHHRDGGAVCAALEGDRYAELICDGIHISPEMIRLAYRLKGAKRTVLVSDSMEATDMPDGEYAIAGNPAVVRDGRAYTPEGALAGSTLSLAQAVENLMAFCGISLEEAILCATENPAREVGVFDVCGSIDVGKRADLLFLKDTKRMDIRRILLRGEWVTPFGKG